MNLFRTYCWTFMRLKCCGYLVRCRIKSPDNWSHSHLKRPLLIAPNKQTTVMLCKRTLTHAPSMYRNEQNKNNAWTGIWNNFRRRCVCLPSCYQPNHICSIYCWAVELFSTWFWMYEWAHSCIHLHISPFRVTVSSYFQTVFL